MDTVSFVTQEKMFRLQEELLAAEEEREMGCIGCTVVELDVWLDSVLDKV